MKNKKIIAAVLALSITSCSCCAFSNQVNGFTVNASETAAATENQQVLSDSGLIYNVFSDHAEVVNCESNKTSVEIPDTFEGVPVTAVRDQSLSICSRMATLSIGKNVSEIYNINIPEFFNILLSDENENFSVIDNVLYNKDKTDIIIYPRGKKVCALPDTMTTIKKGIFTGTEISDITIPDSVKTIEDEAFMNCKNLKSVNIPGSVESIGDRAFYYCTSITSINMSEGIKTIGAAAFSASATLKSIDLPDSLCKIGDDAFCGCRGIDTVKFPSNDVKLGVRPFNDLKNIILSEDNQYYTVEDHMLMSKDKSRIVLCIPIKIRDYTTPDSVTEIDDSAFSGTKIIKVNLGPNVKKIGTNSFDWCSELEEIVINNPDCIIAENADDPNKAINNYHKDFTSKCTYEEWGYEYHGGLYGHKGSAVQEWANQNSYVFTALEDRTDAGYGDVNLDTLIDMTDLTMLSMHVAGDINLESKALYFADTNGDFEVNICDVAVLKQYIMDDYVRLGPFIHYD